MAQGDGREIALHPFDVLQAGVVDLPVGARQSAGYGPQGRGSRRVSAVGAQEAAHQNILLDDAESVVAVARGVRVGNVGGHVTGVVQRVLRRQSIGENESVGAEQIVHDGLKFRLRTVFKRRVERPPRHREVLQLLWTEVAETFAKCSIRSAAGAVAVRAAVLIAKGALGCEVNAEFRQRFHLGAKVDVLG